MITPQRVATLCVGVSEYTPSVLDVGEQPLRFAATSARELHEAFRQLWSGADSLHVLRVDREVTAERLTRDAHELARGAPFDLFLVYIAGHGRTTGSVFSLALPGHAEGPTVVSAGELDTLVSVVPATSRIVLLDACYAGAFLDTSALVRIEDVTEFSFVLASARRDQRSWEDAVPQRTLFADGLLRGLAGEAAPGRTTIDVAADLCAFVAEHVTRHAYGLKAGVDQQPVWATAATTALVLPRAPAARRRFLTTHQALVRRTRQILASVGATAFVTVIALFATTWRPALNDAGFLELRAGPKWLSPLNLGSWARRVETDIQQTDLIPTAVDPTLLPRLRDELGVYPWLGRNATGLRRWIDVVQPWLTEDAALRWRTRLDTLDPATLLTRTRFGIPTVTSAHATGISAERALLRNAAATDPATTRQWQSSAFGVPCGVASLTEEARERTALFADLTSDVEHTAWLHDVARAARAGNGISFAHVHELIDRFHALHLYTDEQYRATLGGDEPLNPRRIAARLNVRPTRIERAALVEIADAVAVRRARVGQSPIPRDVAARLVTIEPACSDWVVPVLARLAPPAAAPHVRTWARTRTSFDQGRGAFAELARRRQLPDEDVMWVLGLYGFATDERGTRASIVSTGEWLTTIARMQPLPVMVTRPLLQHAQAAIARGEDDKAFDALLPVVWSAERLPPDARLTLISALRSLRRGAPLALMGAREVEFWGIVGRAGLVDRRVVETLFAPVLEHSDLEVVFTSPPADNGAEHLAAGMTFTDVLALARLVRGGAVAREYRTDRVARFFERAAVEGLRAKHPERELLELFETIALLHTAREGAAFAPAVVQRMLASSRDDATHRRCVVETARAHVRSLAPRDAWAAIDGYRARWKVETEPDVKYAWATLILAAEEDVNVTRVLASDSKRTLGQVQRPPHIPATGLSRLNLTSDGVELMADEARPTERSKVELHEAAWHGGEALFARGGAGGLLLAIASQQR